MIRTTLLLATLGQWAAARPYALPRRDATTSLGITYDIFNADNSCKTQAQVNTDFQNINGYSLVRLYGTECDQLNIVSSAAIAKGMRVMAGVYHLDTASDDVSSIISVFQSKWDSLDTVSVGNELINSGRAAVADVVDAVNAARDQLRAAGFQGPVVTVDTFNAIIAHPELCAASDYAAANAHAFFDSTCPSSNAGNWAVGKASDVSNACGGKSVAITESGWPHQGDTNGAAIPGVSQQQEAIAGLIGNFSGGGMMIFNAFDDPWKTDFEGTFNAEKYWGIYATPSYAAARKLSHPERG